jgi:hypothetical protein
MFSGTATNFLNLVTVNLMDNKAVDKVQNINFVDKDSGFLVTFSKTPESTGFFTDQPGGKDRYTLTGIRMEIAPVKIVVSPFN